jgi:EAL domain-containing protein (putative c-di-GMP-specific phosphodiesterase class I)
MATEMEPGPGGPVRVTRVDWSARIREALERDRFALYAQPIVDVRSGETLRHELFLRMVDDDDRLIPAGQFVVVAEEHGSIREIDRWVTARAIEFAAAGHPVHLNLSMRSTDAELLELIRLRAAEAMADPGDLVFELGEAQLADASDAAAGFVRAVADLGCGVALDQCVTGAEATTLMRRHPLSHVKIGPPLIAGVAGSGDRGAVTSTVLRAHRSGQRVIAQGIESLALLEQLEDLGIDEAQGHAFGPVEPAEALLGP